MPNGLKLGILAIFVVICISNSAFPTSFGEEEKVKWIIEDESMISGSNENKYSSTKFDDSDTSNIFKNIRSNNKSLFEPVTLACAEQGKRYKAGDFVEALKIINKTSRQMEEFFKI